jgi:hypothetical protein
MPFPATMTLVTVAIQWDLPPSGGARGHVDFEAPYPLLGAADGSIIPPFKQRASLTAAGTGTIQLPATNDPQWSPTGWAYTVTARIGGQTVTGTLQLDHQTASVQLADLLQVDGAAVAGTSYLLTAQRSVAFGVAGLDADGDVINAAGEKVGEAAGGGISETIVNAKGDLIAATANDAVARFAVGADGQYLKAASGETTGLQWDTLTATDITDSTTVGRAVLTAANAAAGRTAIDAEATGVAAALVDDLSGVSNASTARTNLGLGGAAVLNVGTTAGTVAAGDDIRMTNARTPTAHASTHADGGSDEISIDSSQITSGTVAIARIPTGTSGTTVALGDAPAGAVTTHVGLGDPHTQYALEASLGGAAVLNVGTSTGTVAAGDDSRITGAQQRSTLTTKGDLYVATGSGTVVRVGIGSNDQVLTADSAETAGVKWATGGGGSSIAIAHGYVTSGDVTPQTTASWAVMTSSPTFSIAAVAGDVVTVDWTALIDPVSAMFLDLCVIVSGAVTKYAATGTSSNGIEGDPGLYPDVPAFHPSRGYGMTVTCASGDLSGGTITFGFAVINPNGGGKLYARTIRCATGS